MPHPRRWAGGPLDVVLTCGLVVWGVVEALSFPSGSAAGVRVAFALAATLPLAARSVAPLPVAAWAAGVFWFDASTAVLPVEAVTPLPGVPVAAYAVAVHTQPLPLARLVPLLGIAGIPAVATLGARDAPVTPGDIAALTAVMAVAALAGWVVRSRREEAATALASAAHGRRARERGLRENLLDERFRIAAELRAIVARDLGEMDRRLSGETRPAVPASPERLRAAAESVQHIASEAVVEMQRLLRVLREERSQDPAPVTPATAVSAAIARGWTVDLREHGDAAATAPGAIVAAGRVLEEVMTESPPTGYEAVTAWIEHRAGGVRARLSGRRPPSATVPTEAARARVEERAALHGGRVRIRRRLRRWTVELEIPHRGGGLRSASGASADVAVVLLASAAVAADAFVPLAGPGTSHWALTVTGGLLLFVVPLALRRRAPLAVASILAVGHLAQTATGVVPPSSYSLVPLLILGCHAVARHGRTRRRAIAGGLALGAAGVGATALGLGDPTPPTDLPIVVYLAAGSWATGWAARSTGGWALRLRAGEARAAAEHPAQVQAAIDGERRRVARDLHDVVAHGVSLAGVLAGAARATAFADPDRAAAGLATAAEAVAETRVELARIAALLRVDVEGPPPLAMADVGRLVERVRKGGQDISLDVDVDLDAAVPHGVAASVFRIVQEALTNARKHAPGAAVRVRIGQAAGMVRVEIENETANAPQGHGARQGIAGMRERARALGGHLETGETPSGGFVVRAHLPIGEVGAPHRSVSRPRPSADDRGPGPGVASRSWTSTSPRGA